MSKLPQPHILFVARDEGGCGFYRCLQPANFLARSGLATTEYVFRYPSEAQLLAADLVIMQNMGDVKSAQTGNFLLQHNIPFLTEIDDFLHHVSPHNLGGYGGWNPGTLCVHRAMDLVRRSFGLTVSTPQLAREYFPYQPRIYVIPNYLDRDLWDNPLVKKQDNKIRIGWAGGNAHADDLKMIAPAIEKVVRESKGQVVFDTMGMTKQELAGVFTLKDIVEECPECGFNGEIHHFPGESLQNYPMIMMAKGWDIAVAPVIDNSFGNCKSDLKIKEYAAAGIPVVASSVVPYREARALGADILFADNFGEWYNNLVRLVKDEKLRASMVKNNREWVEKNYIQEQIFSIFEVYRQVLAQAQAVLKRN